MYILLSDPQFVYCTKFRFYSVNNQKQNVKARLSNNLRTVLGEYHRQHSVYFEQAAQAAFKTLNHYDQDNNKFYIDIDLYSRTKEVINLQAESSSVGLGYALGCALAMRDQLEKQDTINTIIFTTGEVSNSGNVLKIGYIENKIKGALLAMRDINGASPCKTNTPFIIFYPRSNHDDITAEIKEQVKLACGELVPVEHLQQALKHILGKSYDGSLVQDNRTFKGLSSFDFYDSTLFFGRDELIAKLLDIFNKEQSLIKVHGVSGCGKSSLVKAGFLPEVCKANKTLKYAITEPIRHDNNKSLLEYLLIHSDAPLLFKEMITEEALSKLISDILVCPKASIAQIKEKLPDKKHQLIWYIDQFEQAFFRSKDTNLLQVLNELSLAIESLTIIVSIRSEYVEHTGKIGRDYYVEHELSSRSWHAIIHDQALCFGIKFEAELVEHIQEQAKKMSHALPAVEYLLTQMYEYAQRQGYCKTLTFKHYHGVGGLVGVITSQADNAFKPYDKRLLNEFFEIFVGINQDKKPYIKRVNLTELEKNNVDLFSLVKALINKQLVIKHHSEQDTTYVKLAHDCLINFSKDEKEQTQYWQTFVKWFEVNKTYLVWFGQIEARFKRWKNEKNEIHLLNEADLKEAEQFFTQVDLINQQIVRDYIIKSQRHQSKLLKIETKKQRKRTLLFSLLALIAMGSSFVAWQQKRVAEEQAKKASETNVKLWNNIAQYTHKTEEKIEAALSALANNTTGLSLKESITTVNIYGTKPVEITPYLNGCIKGNKKVVSSSQRGDLIVLVFDDVSACTVNVKTQESINVQLHSGSNCGVTINDEQIVALSDSGRVITWLPGQAEPKVTKSINEFHQCLASSNDGKFVVITSKHGIHGLVDLKKESVEWFNNISITGVPMAVNNSGSWLVTKNEGKLYFFNLTTGKFHQGPDYMGDENGLMFYSEAQTLFLMVRNKNNNIRVFDVATGDLRHEFTKSPTEIRRGQSPDHSTDYITYSTGGVKINKGGTVINFFVKKDPDKHYPLVHISENNDKVFTINRDGLIRQFYINANKELAAHRHDVTFMTFAQSKHLLASADTSGDIVIWDMDEQVVLTKLDDNSVENKHPLSTDSSPVRHLAFINDDEELVAVHANGVVKHWHVKSGKLQTSFYIESLQGFKTLVIDNVARNIIWHTQENAIYSWQEDTQTTTPLLKGIDQIKFAFYNDADNSFMLYTGSGDVEYTDKLNDIFFTGDEKEYKFSIADQSLVEIKQRPLSEPEAFWLRDTGKFSLNNGKFLVIDGDETAIFAGVAHGADFFVELGLGDKIMFKKVILAPDASYFISVCWKNDLHIWSIDPLYKTTEDYQRDLEYFYELQGK